MLIAITGPIASGKTTFRKIASEYKYITVDMDEIVNQWYCSPNEGYRIIKNTFGNTYVNDKFVNKHKLLLTVINDQDKFALLNHVLRPLFIKFLEKLQKKYENSLIFVEMGNLMSNFEHFGKYFSKTIIIKRNLDKRKLFLEKKYKHVEKFSTNYVEKIENTFKVGSFSPDFIVENDKNIEDLRKKFIFLMQKIK